MHCLSLSVCLSVCPADSKLRVSFRNFRMWGGGGGGGCRVVPAVGGGMVGVVLAP